MRFFTAFFIGCAALCGMVRAQSDYVAAEPLHAAGLMKFWQLQLPLQPGEAVADLYRVDDFIYATTSTGHVFAIHANTGVIRWLQQVTTGGYHITAPVHAKGRAIFVVPSMIVQFDMLTGDPVRRINLRFPAASPPISNGKRIWFGGIDRRIYCFDPDNDYEEWKAATDSPVTARPALFGKHLICASSGGVIYTCVAANKRIVRSARSGDPISADLTVGPQGVFIASEDQSLYLLSPQFGTKIWRTRLSSPLQEPPVVTSDMAYQYSPDDGVVAIDARVDYVADRIVWKLPQGRLALTADDKYAYVQSAGGNLLVVDKLHGEVAFTVPTDGLDRGVPAPLDQSVFLAASDGRLFCARPIGAPALKAEALADAFYGDRPAAPPSSQPAPPAATQPADTRRETAAPTAPPIGGTSKVSKGQSPGTPPPPEKNP